MFRSTFAYPLKNKSFEISDPPSLMASPAMAVKGKTLINCLLLIVTVWTRLHLLVAENFNSSYWGICGTNQYRNGSDFQHNLNQVFESLLGNVSTSGFSTSVEGQNGNSIVYGLAQCRGDLNSSECEQCASATKAFLVEKCHNSTSGFLLLNDCFLRYDNHKFYNDYTDSSQVMNVVCDGNKSYEPVQFGNGTWDVLSDIIEKAVQSPELFATSKVDLVYSDSREIYSLAQCWRDLSPTNCRSCLDSGRSRISGTGRLNNSATECATGAIGARYRSRNCDLHYEIYSFFDTSIILQPTPPSPEESSPESGGKGSGKGSKVVPIAVGVVAATAGLIASIGLCKCIIRRKRIPIIRGEEGEISLSLPTVNPELLFKYHILREATSNFTAENKLGEGGFGSVFKGVLPDGREVAVKRLKIGSRQGEAEFLNEANLISRVQHRNLVKLLGCCVQSSERLLVYEYLQNGSLDKIIFDPAKGHSLKWRERYEIIVGTARGLAYLHQESEIRIIHRDIKASNILLDDKHRPKITDFGLAKLFAEDQSHVSTRVAGTFGYMAPEYALRGQLTEKADVFSFGVLLLEILSGRKNQSLAQGRGLLIQGTWRLYKEERALEIMDSTMEGSYSWEEGNRVIKIGLLCTQAVPLLRPSMSQVVSMLTSARENLASPTKPAFVDLDGVVIPDQVLPGRFIDPDKTSSSAATSSTAFSSSAATSSTTASEIHSAAADPSSGILQPR